MPAPHPPEFRRRAVDLANQVDEDGRQVHSIATSAKDLGISESCLRRWMDQDYVDTGKREGLSSKKRQELVELRRGARTLEFVADVAEPGSFSRTIEAAIREEAAYRATACAPRLLVPSVGLATVHVVWNRPPTPTERRGQLDEAISDSFDESDGTPGSYRSLRVSEDVSNGCGDRQHSRGVDAPTGPAGSVPPRSASPPRAQRRPASPSNVLAEVLERFTTSAYVSPIVMHEATGRQCPEDDV